MLRPTGDRGQIDMSEQVLWWKQLRRAAAESSSFGRNWRWMLIALAIGAGLGLVAGLHRQGKEPAHLSLDVGLTVLRAAVFVFVVVWLVVVAKRALAASPPR
jgi:hypothetical protein